MMPMDIKNIYITENSCRDAPPCMNMALKLPQYFTCWWRSLLVATSKFSLLTIIWHSATRKHLFLYPQGDRSSLKKPKTDMHQHLSQLPSAFISLASLNCSNNKVRFSFNQPSRKRWGAKLVDVKHIPHKAFLLWHHH